MSNTISFSFVPDNNFIGVGVIDNSFSSRAGYNPSIVGNNIFNSSSNNRRFGLHQRYGLRHLLGGNERSGNVVIFQKWNQSRRNSNYLTGNDFNIFSYRN